MEIEGFLCKKGRSDKKVLYKREEGIYRIESVGGRLLGSTTHIVGLWGF